ncbi:multicopper oxidase-domain-containing protein [Aspergillus aurantiobrunneus]
MGAIHRRWSLLGILCLVRLVTCRAVRFGLNLTWEDREIAGVVRKVILSNGQLPGPTLGVKQGDEVECSVTNLMPFATTVHFHGIIQLGTPWSDGTPGLSQEPIEPGDTFIYRWTAVKYGSYAYHSHSRGRLIDGLYGAIYVEPEKSVEKPFKLTTEDATNLFAMIEAEAKTEPLMLSDWRFLTSEVIWQAELDSGCESICSNAILINGKGSAWCLPQAKINNLAIAGQRILLGNHTLTDIGCFPSIDSLFGTYPRETSLLPRGFDRGCIPGDGPEEIIRVDPHSLYISRDVISMAGSSNLVFAIDEHPMYVYAIDGRYVQPIFVEAIEIPTGSRYSVLVELKQNRSAGDYTSAPPTTDLINLSTARAQCLVPFPIQLPAPTLNRTFILNIERYHDSYRWQLGNSSYPLNLEDAQPALFNSSSIAFPHSVSTFNDTWLRDTFSTLAARGPSGRWFAIRYEVINPGPFRFHCHLQMHQTGGMALALMDGVDAWPIVPEEYQLSADKRV